MSESAAGTSRGKPLLLSLVVVLLLGGAGLAYWYLRPTPGEAPPDPNPPKFTGDISAEVHTFCGACHVYPPAETFPRSAWKKEVERGYVFFSEDTLDLTPPPIDEVIRYYEKKSPVEFPKPNIVPASKPFGLQLDRVGIPCYPKTSPPAVSFVNSVHLFDDKKPELLACEMRWGQILLMQYDEKNPTWQELGKVNNPAHAEVVDFDGDGHKDVLVADLGSFSPTDRRCGSVVLLRGRGDKTFEPVKLLENVGRVADAQAVDFTGDGKTDVVVAAFGWRKVGKVYLLENKTTDWADPKFETHILDDRAGSIHVPVIDLNGDKRPDFIAVFAQEHEEIVAFLNEGAGKFRKERIYLASHPGYGSSGIQLVDLDNDGDQDILYTNGDVLDAPYLLKPYHSIQWLENKGGTTFEHHPLTSMYGVHRAVADDIDGDGDKDIVAVSFLPIEGFPDRAEKNLDSIIVLEQTEPGKFERHTIERKECNYTGCVLGDFTGDGKLDLAVGNFTSAKLEHSVVLWSQ